MGIYPHTVTAWLKDDAERVAKWERVLITECRMTETHGARPSRQGDTSAREAILLVNAVSCSLKRGDRIMLGVSVEEKPPAESYTVDTVHPVFLGDSPHHFEVSLA